MEQLLPLAHHAQIAVVQVADLDRQAELLAGRQLLDVHLDRGFAGHAGDLRVRVGQLGAHGVGHADAHGAQAAGVEPAARLVEFVILRGPHLVLADIGGDEGVAAGHFPQFFDYVLRLDDLVRILVLHAVAAAPLVDLLPPGGQGRSVLLVLALVEQAGELFEHFLDVADDGYVDLHALGDGGRVDVDVDDLARLGGEVRRVADHTVIEAGADGQQHVGEMHRHVGFVGAVHARHAEVLLVGGGVAAQTHQGVGDRHAQLAHQLGQRRSGVGQDHATAGVNHRALGFEQQLERFLDLALMAFDHRVVRPHLDRLRVVILGALGGDVLGDVYQHRARPAGLGQMEGLFDGGGDVRRVLDQEVVFDTGARDAHGVDFLEGVLADGGGRHLAADDHHRDRVAVGRGDAGDGIGCTRAGGYQGDADGFRRARVGIGRVNGSLLVAYQDVTYLLLLEQRVINEKHCTARIAEHIVDLFFLQAPDYNFRPSQDHYCP